MVMCPHSLGILGWVGWCGICFLQGHSCKMRKILPASLPHCVVVVTRWNNKCGISLKLQLNLHKSDAILKGHSYSGQFGPPLATSGRVLFFPGASAGKRGHQVPWGFHTCSESGWSWDSSEKPQRMDKQITLPTKKKTNNPRGRGEMAMGTQFTDKSPKWHFIYLKRCCLPHNNRSANF